MLTLLHKVGLLTTIIRVGMILLGKKRTVKDK